MSTFQLSVYPQPSSFPGRCRRPGGGGKKRHVEFRLVAGCRRVADGGQAAFQRGVCVSGRQRGLDGLARKIMADDNCQGICVNCLPLVQNRLIPAPPCIARLRLNDEGPVGACEADWNAPQSVVPACRDQGRSYIKQSRKQSSFTFLR